MDFIKTANSVLQNEIENLQRVKNSFDNNFAKATSLIINCKGRILVSGIGKSFLIGRKIASVFSSVGTPSFFIHPVEAVHGDLGCFEKDDILLALSCSGNTKEVQNVVLFCKKHGIKSISITCKKHSFLVKHCDASIILDMKEEAITGLPVPTTSCIMTLAVCDAITACIVKQHNFSQEQYVELHSGGYIGKTIKKLIKRKNLKKLENQKIFYKNF